MQFQIFTEAGTEYAIAFAPEVNLLIAIVHVRERDQIVVIHHFPEIWFARDAIQAKAHVLDGVRGKAALPIRGVTDLAELLRETAGKRDV